MIGGKCLMSGGRPSRSIDGPLLWEVFRAWRVSGVARLSFSNIGRELIPLAISVGVRVRSPDRAGVCVCSPGLDICTLVVDTVIHWTQELFRRWL